VSNIVVLNSETHRSLKVQGRPSAELGDNQRFVQVIITEFPHLAVQYPILLSKDANTGAFYCGAMLGFDQGENLFLSDGAHEGYRPLNLQRMPFYVSGGDLGIDLDHPRVGAEQAQPLFNGQGEPTEYLESIKAAFRELKPGLERTKQFVDMLLSLRMVEPVSIDVGFDDGTVRDVVGLYTIDQRALHALPDATVLELFRRGYLQSIYLMVASLKQVKLLAQKKNGRLLRA
jgi:SapC protein